MWWGFEYFGDNIEDCGDNVGDNIEDNIEDCGDNLVDLMKNVVGFGEENCYRNIVDFVDWQLVE
jgi:hypothetical protein